MWCFQALLSQEEPGAVGQKKHQQHNYDEFKTSMFFHVPFNSTIEYMEHLASRGLLPIVLDNT